MVSIARFVYRMQGILNLKQKTEEQARMDFGVSQSNLNREEDKLSELVRRKNEYIEEAVRLREQGILNVRDILDNRYAEAQMDVLIERQQAVVESFRLENERVRMKLAKCIQERKAQEKLRERAFEQFVEEEKEAEAKESDQRTSFTYAQRTRE